VLQLVGIGFYKTSGVGRSTVPDVDEIVERNRVLELYVFRRVERVKKAMHKV
jgi:hypothetical protein